MKTPETIIGPDRWEYVKLTEWEHMNRRIATLEAEVESERVHADAWKSSLDFETKRREKAEALVRELHEGANKTMICMYGEDWERYLRPGDIGNAFSPLANAIAKAKEAGL